MKRVEKSEAQKLEDEARHEIIVQILYEATEIRMRRDLEKKLRKLKKDMGVRD